MKSAETFLPMQKLKRKHLKKVVFLCYELIKGEEDAIRMYSEVLKKLNVTYEAEASMVLKEILREERHHKQELEVLLRSYP